MSSNETPDDEEKFLDAADNCRLSEVIELSSKFKNNVDVLSEALKRSCVRGRTNHLDVVKWLAEHTAAKVDYNKGVWTPLIAACWNDHLDTVKIFGGDMSC